MTRIWTNWMVVLQFNDIHVYSMSLSATVIYKTISQYCA